MGGVRHDNENGIIEKKRKKETGRVQVKEVRPAISL